MPRAENPTSKTRNAKLRKLIPALLSWFAINARDLPWRRRRDPYAIWVSEIMLQQTQVRTVLPFWDRWMRELPTIEALANASSERIHKLWEGLGYYTRVRNMQKAARFIRNKHGGRFPESFQEVLALPGIGRYTAGAICSIAFNQPTPVLDGNVIRVLTRVFGIAENPREKRTNALLWQMAASLVAQASRIPHPASRIPYPASRIPHPVSRIAHPASRIPHPASALNQSLMELGALICAPRNPQCGICPVNKLCLALHENRVGELPNLGRRVATTARHFIAFVVERQGRFLVRQRPAGVVNAHLWEFPNVEVKGSRVDLQMAARRALGFEPGLPEPLCTLRHSITRYRIQLDVYAANANRRPGISQTKGRWLTLCQLQALSFPSAHKKVLLRLLARDTVLEKNSSSGWTRKKSDPRISRIPANQRKSIRENSRN